MVRFAVATVTTSTTINNAASAAAIVTNGNAYSNTNVDVDSY